MKKLNCNIIRKIVEIISVIIPFLYIFMYIYAFSIWNTGMDTSEPIYLEDEMFDILFVVGLACMISCVGYRVLVKLEKTMTYWINVLCSILQILILGIKSKDLLDIVPMLPIDAMSRIEDIIRKLNKEEQLQAVNHLCRVSNCIGVIEICLMVSVLLSIIAIALGNKKENSIAQIIENDANGKYEIVMRVINIFMITVTIIFHVVLSYVMDDTNIAIFTTFSVVGVIPVFLFFVVNIFVEKKKYVICVISYVCGMLAGKNIAYHAYHSFFELRGYDFGKVTNIFIVCMTVGIIVSVVNCVCWFWEYKRK